MLSPAVQSTPEQKHLISEGATKVALPTIFYFYIDVGETKQWLAVLPVLLAMLMAVVRPSCALCNAMARHLEQMAIISK